MNRFTMNVMSMNSSGYHENCINHYQYFVKEIKDSSMNDIHIIHYSTGDFKRAEDCIQKLNYIVQFEHILGNKSTRDIMKRVTDHKGHTTYCNGCTTFMTFKKLKELIAKMVNEKNRPTYLTYKTFDDLRTRDMLSIDI